MSIPVIDPFGLRHNPEVPWVAGALDPAEAVAQLGQCFARRGQKRVSIHLCAIRVTRWKPQRRGLVEYDVQLQGPEAAPQALTVIGKIRAKGLDKTTFKINKALWEGGFGGESADGVCVPEPIGTIPEFRMWLQLKHPGTAATEGLLGPDGVALAGRIAEALCKLHRAPAPTPRRHTMADELRILHERLGVLGERQPRWRKRLEGLLAACDRLGAAIEQPDTAGIHRDFYPAQVIVDGSRLCLIDFDLYCVGDPALDAGNFLGHLTEQSLRAFGHPSCLAEHEKAFAERFLELSGAAAQARVEAYATLTLVRHISLSTEFPERHSTTEPLIELCEQRLSRS